MKKRTVFLFPAVIPFFLILAAVPFAGAQTPLSRSLETRSAPAVSNVTVVDLRKASPLKVETKTGINPLSQLPEKPVVRNKGTAMTGLTQPQLNVALRSVNINLQSSGLYAHLTPIQPYVANKACMLLHFPWRVFPHYVSFANSYNGYVVVEVRDKGSYIIDVLLEVTEGDPQTPIVFSIFKWGKLYKSVNSQGVSGPQHLVIIADQDSDMTDFPREAFGEMDWLHVYCSTAKTFASWNVYQIDITRTSVK